MAASVDVSVATAQSAPVADAARGAEAFRRFYVEQFPDLAGYCLALTADGDLADEFAQEALIRVYVRWGLLREPRAYAFRVAHNLVKDHWKARCRELATWVELTDQAEVSQLPDQTVWDAVRRLPQSHREVVVLHYVADLPLHEIARVLQRPLGTVKRRVHDARVLLAGVLGEDR